MCNPVDIAQFTAYSPTHPTPVTNKAGMRGDTIIVFGKWKIGKRSSMSLLTKQIHGQFGTHHTMSKKIK